MKDIETITERNIASAVIHAASSNRELWQAAYQSSKVYGRYEEHATKEIARRAGRSVAAVQSWVEAYRAFALCYQANPCATRKLRRTLTLTHFRRIYAFHTKYELTADQCLYFLSLMTISKANGENYGPDALEQEIDTDLRYGGLKPDVGVDWHYHWDRLRKPLEILASFDGELPQEIKQRILDLLVLFDEKYYDTV